MIFTNPSGSLAIGSPVIGGTQGSVPFFGADGALSQDNSNFFWDSTDKQLILKQGTNYVSPLSLWENAQHPYGYWIEFSDNNGTSLGELRASNSEISIEPVNGFRVERFGYNGGQVLMNVSTANANPFKVVSGQATSVPILIQLAASQSADALQVKNSGGTTKFSITKDGACAVDSDCGFVYASTHYMIPYNGGAGQYFTNSVAGDTCIRTGVGKSVRIGVSTVESIIVDDSATAGNTRLLVYDVDNGQVERVTVGAADSGGAGYKVLRIPN